MRYYTTKKHLANTPQEYFVLRILNQHGQLINVRTGKKWGYISSIIKAAKLKKWETIDCWTYLYEGAGSEKRSN